METTYYRACNQRVIGILSISTKGPGTFSWKSVSFQNICKTRIGQEVLNDGERSKNRPYLRNDRKVRWKIAIGENFFVRLLPDEPELGKDPRFVIYLTIDLNRRKSVC